MSHYKHIVVLMLENRSFDHLLGSLAGVDGPKTYTLSQRRDIPLIDPGEEYYEVFEQLTGRSWNPQETWKDITMQGWTKNYLKILQHHEPALDSMEKYQHFKEYQYIQNPELIPVITTLAREFAVCDHWHCAVPTQTLPNRSFFHAGTSNGAVLNEGKKQAFFWPFFNHSKTFFEQLQENKLSWKVYFDKHNVLPLTLLIHYQRLKTQRNFYNLEEFYNDLEKQTLPYYTFLEPRFLLLPNDYHCMDSDSLPTHSSVAAGEQFLSEIYNAIRKSPLRDDILFVITFDEHGGTPDHVVPPRCETMGSGECGFDFSILGVRVPTILIASDIHPQVVKQNLDHNSMMASIRSWKDIKESLTVRDRNAPLIPEIWKIKKKKKSLDSSRVLRKWPILSPPTFLHTVSGREEPIGKFQAMYGNLFLSVMHHIMKSALRNERRFAFTTKRSKSDGMLILYTKGKKSVGELLDEMNKNKQKFYSN